MIKSDKFEAKTSWKYTQTSQSKIMAKTDTPLAIFSEILYGKVILKMHLNIPPPSKTPAGYKFIIASEKLETIKKLLASPLIGKARKIRAEIILKIIPPKQIIISFK